MLNAVSIGVVIHWMLVVGIGVRVINKRPQPGVALAWLFLVALVPYAGALIYLLIGERRIDPAREREMITLHRGYRRLFGPEKVHGPVEGEAIHEDPTTRRLDALGGNLAGSHAVGGNAYQLFDNTETVLHRIASEVDAAKTSVVMVFYIWGEGGAADAVTEAIVRAAKRGVSCRLLIDALGARPWWRSRVPSRLRAAGVEVRAALPAGLIRSFVGRTDLRLHRKIVVIDGTIAWTGSMNMVDPRYFKTDAGVGEWIDAMVRLEGPAVAPLAATAIADWRLETGEPVVKLVQSAGLHLNAPVGTVDMQVIPSGPGISGDGLLQMMIALIDSARERLVLTTPYFVPDVSLLRALARATGRGVEVGIVVPERVDSVLARYAARSYYDDLLGSGIAVHLYRGGLLHTKSITIDRARAMFGTANFDMRSLWLNYEVTLFVYDAGFAGELADLQDSYIRDSDRLDPERWARRRPSERFTENAARLISPLL